MVIPFEVPLWIGTIVGGALMTSTAAYGYRGLHSLSAWTVPFLGIVLIAGLFVALNRELIDVLTITSQAETSIGVFISIVAGSFMVGAALMADLTRFARTVGDAIKGSVVGYLIAGPTILFLFTVLAMATGEKDFFSVLNVLGLGSVGLLVLIFASWTTNDSNLYSTSLALASIHETPHRKLTWIVGALGTGIALFGVLGNFLNFVLLLSIVITPIIGIVALEIFVFRKIDDENDRAVRKQYNVIGLVAWILGALFAYSTTPVISSGLGLITLTTIPVVDGVIASAILYFLGRKLF